MRPCPRDSGARIRAARGVRLAAVTVCALVLGGCTAPAAGVVRTSGPLADGFEIEAGSALMGAVFPLAFREGRQVVLGVDGDMERVFAGYVRQAEALGHPMTSAWPRRPEAQWCSDPDDGVTADDPRDGSFEIECSAYGETDGLPVSLRGLAEPDGQGYIHLTIASGSSVRSTVPDGPVAPVTDVEVAPELGSSSVDPPLRLAEGSELLFDPLASRCDAGSYIAMLRVTGDLLPVMRAYGEQFNEAEFVNEGVLGGEDDPRVYGGMAGGGDLSATGLRGDPSYVLIEHCNSN